MRDAARVAQVPTRLGVGGLQRGAVVGSGAAHDLLGWVGALGAVGEPYGVAAHVGGGRGGEVQVGDGAESVLDRVGGFADPDRVADLHGLVWLVHGASFAG